MDVTKPYKVIGFGAMDVTKPYNFIGFGAMDVTKPYKFIGFSPRSADTALNGVLFTRVQTDPASYPGLVDGRPPPGQSIKKETY